MKFEIGDLARFGSSGPLGVVLDRRAAGSESVCLFTEYLIFFSRGRARPHGVVTGWFVDSAILHPVQVRHLVL